MVAKALAGFALVDRFGLGGEKEQRLKMAHGDGEVVDLCDRMEGLHEGFYFHCMLVIMSVDVVQDHMRARKLLFLVGSFILTFLENRLPFISLRQSSIVAV